MRVRTAVTCAVWGCLVVGQMALSQTALGQVVVKSPAGEVTFKLEADAGGVMQSLGLGETVVLEPGAMSFRVDGVDLCRGATVVESSPAVMGEASGMTRGVKSRFQTRFNGSTVKLKSSSGQGFEVEIRVYDSGVAWRFVCGGSGERTPDEGSVFKVPAGSVMWSHDMRGHYEGTYTKRAVEEFPAGTWAAPPLTFKLPKGGGYLSVMEAAVVGYSGMALEGVGDRSFKVGLGHRQPVSYPYELRYSKEDIARQSVPAKVVGEIRTPWRVVMAAKDLNTMVNSDIIVALAPPPDKTLFPDGLATEWAKPGRAVWRYLDNEGVRMDPGTAPPPVGASVGAAAPAVAATPPATRPATRATSRAYIPISEAYEFSRLAGELGFEYNILEGFWHAFNDADLSALVKYSRERGVAIMVWVHCNELRKPEERVALMDRVQRLGIVGLKVDFFDHEHKETIDLYYDILKDAAPRKLVLDFHGSNKSTGESQTWPNELIREGVRGMEARSLTARAFHETVIPFTRYLTGPAEYTGLLFNQRRGDTSVAHQIGVPVVMTAPLNTFGAHPKKLLESPAVDMIKSIPAVWDETIVLPGSEIGELVVMARRKGETWFLAVLNGPAAKDVDVPMTFLKGGNYEALTVSDAPDSGDAIEVKKESVASGKTKRLSLRAGGGFVARFGLKK